MPARASASRSSSSRSRLPCAFDRLPTELVHQIFDNLEPYPFFPSCYQERQAAFRRLSLVSKRFASFAQHFLLRVVKLSTHGVRTASRVDSILRMLRRSDLGKGNKVEILIVENLEPKHRLEVEGVKGLRETLVGLSFKGNAGQDNSRRLRPWASSLILPEERARNADFIATLSFHCLPPFMTSNLRRLHLDMVTIPDLTPFSFPLLLQLSLRNVVLPSKDNFLFSLPSVRHYSSKATENKEKYFLLAALLPQLVSFTIPLDELLLLPKPALESPVPRLVTTAFSDYPNFLFEDQRLDVSHLRLEGDSTVNLKRSNDWLYAIVQIEGPVALRLIYIPLALDSCPDLAEWILGLESVCRAKGIEVVKEEMGTSSEEYSRMSQDFIARADDGRVKGGRTERG